MTEHDALWQAHVDRVHANWERHLAEVSAIYEGRIKALEGRLFDRIAPPRPTRTYAAPGLPGWCWLLVAMWLVGVQRVDNEQARAEARTEMVACAVTPLACMPQDGAGQ